LYYKFKFSLKKSKHKHTEEPRPPDLRFVGAACFEELHYPVPPHRRLRA